jgi:O-antigen ligase
LFVHRFGAFSYLRHLFVGASVLAAMVAAAAFVLPDLVLQGTRLRGDGIADAGTVSVIGLVFCLSNVPPLKRRTSLALLVLFGVLLVVSRTRTAYVAFLIYLAFGYVYGRNLPVRKVVPLLAVVSVGLLFAEVLSDATGFFVREPQSLQTMSDRIPLWRYLTAVVMRESPLTGLGYYAASRVYAPQYNEALGNAHSAFFEILLGGGIVAASLYVAFFASLVFSAFTLLGVAERRPEILVVVGLVVVALLLAVTSVAVHVGPSGFTFWSLSALVPALRRRYAQAPSSGRQRLPLRRFAHGDARSGSPSVGI